MNWFYETIIWQAVLTIIPCLIIVSIFKAANRKSDERDEKEDL